MNTLSRFKSFKTITLRDLRLLAAANAVIVATVIPVVLRFCGIHAPFWFWIGVFISVAVTHFVLTFVGLRGVLSLGRWLEAKREQWDTTTKRWFQVVMVFIAVLCFIAAFYVFPR